MTPQQILFILVAIVTLGAGFMVVSTPNMIRAAFWLILDLFGISIFYVLLNAGFLAIVQVVVYIGAIATLIIFAVMMTRRLMKDTEPQETPTWWLAALVSLATFGGLAWMLSQWGGFSSQAQSLPAGTDTLAQLGAALVAPNGYVLPFELASVLLLAALVGAIVIAWERRS